MKLYLFILISFITISQLIAQVNFTSSNLPILVINTNGQEIPDEPKIEADLGIIYNGNGVRNYITDPFNNYNGKIGIELRGSSSQSYPKKQYAMETRDISGENLNVSLLGMPEENDWVLYAPYSDKSLMRNVLSYKMANDLGWYASRTRYCELVLNGDYRGVYVLMEKIKRDNNRVDIKKLDPEDIAGNNLTGGYIIKIDKLEGEETDGWHSDFPPYPGAWQQIYYQYHYPKGSSIVWQQQNYIQNYIFQFESMMDGENYTHLFNGYYDFINFNSFVDFFILNEIGKNIDGYRLSTFLYKDRDSEGGELHIGPIWDYNLAFGNVDFYDGSNIQNWQVDFNISSDMNQIPFWWGKLMDDPVFLNKIVSRWFELRADILNTNSILNFIDEVADSLEESQTRNFIRWPILGHYVWPNDYIGDTYNDEVLYLKTWLFSRLYWIDNTFPEIYSKIDWADPAVVSIDIHSEDQNYILISNLIENTMNIDSIVFVSNNPSFQATQHEDTLFFLTDTNGEFLIKGQGYYNGNVVSLSPAYSVSIMVNIQQEEDFQINNFSLHQNYPNPFNPTT
ncbi:MAG: CotH kinase family protein, partial [Calditrichia bacterium]|nr:CotH kinase family protein [Calditrichia bacterium]